MKICKARGKLVSLHPQIGIDFSMVFVAGCSAAR